MKLPLKRMSPDIPAIKTTPNRHPRRAHFRRKANAASAASPKVPTITWLGNASIRLEDSHGTTVLIDPYISMPKAQNKTHARDFQDARAILITHPHLDHLSSVPAIIKTCSPDVFGSPWAKELLEQEVVELSASQPAMQKKVPSVLNRRKAVRKRKTERRKPDHSAIKKQNQPVPAKSANTDKIPTHAVLHTVFPGKRFSIEDIDVRVYRSRHVQFDGKLVLETLNPFHILRYKENAGPLLKKNRHYTLNNQIVLYDLVVDGKKIQVLGSLALDDKTEYPVQADLLFLPYQGSSFKLEKAEEIIRRLQPKAIFVTHIDDAFPPISRTIKTDDLVEMVHAKFPEVKIAVPIFKRRYPLDSLLEKTT